LEKISFKYKSTYRTNIFVETQQVTYIKNDNMKKSDKYIESSEPIIKST